MEMSRNGRTLLAEWEGCRLSVYKDSAGKDTIGVGHQITDHEQEMEAIILSGKKVFFKDGITHHEALDILAQDLRRFEHAVNAHVKVPLNQNQFDALVSFAFNVGVNAFETSTLVKLLNQRGYDEVPEQLKRWNKAGGRLVEGLVNRREKEIALWKTHWLA